MKNSIEEDIKNAEHFINSIKTDKEYKEENGWHGYYNKEIVELSKIMECILSDYKRVLKENEKNKRLAEMNLKNAEEFKENMCEHRCLLKNENEELKQENEELHKEIEKMKSLDIYKLVEDLETGMLISKQKLKDILEKLKNTNFNDYTNQQDGNEIKMKVLYEFEKLLESEEE